MKTKLLIGLILFAFFINVSASNAADTAPVPRWQSTPTFGIDLADSFANFGMAGSLLSTFVMIPESEILTTNKYNRICPSIEVDYCNPQTERVTATAVLKPCLENFSNPCVRGLRIIDQKGEVFETQYVRSIKGTSFTGSPMFNLPDGGTTSLWRSEKVDGVKDFAVRYSIDYSFNTQNTNRFEPNQLSVSIAPFVARQYSQAREYYFEETKPSHPLRSILGWGIRSVGGNDFGVNCVWQETGMCGAEQEFEKDLLYELELVIPKQFSGWLQGRLISPEISVEPISKDLNQMTIRAKAAEVPRVVVDVDYSNTNETFTELFKNHKQFESKRGFRQLPLVDDFNSVRMLDAFAKFHNDKANLKSTKWTFRNVSFPGTSNKCLDSDSQLMGMVTTNSLIYDGGIPAFRDGFLQYRVAGLHYNPDGSEFKGAYDLLLRSEAARCLYGFSNAPISAEISVLGTDGDKKIATTQISESNGWLHLGAYNFTFSQPTINILFKQEVVAPAPSPTPSPTAITTPSPKPTAVGKGKSSITCVKAKTTKKVTAINPKCPTGYKKK
jgi:hypothetical protein